MALVNRSFSVNVTPGMMPPIVHVSEYDVGRAYTVSIIDEQGNTFTIPSETTASIEGTLNGSVGFTQSATVSNNQVSFTLSQSMTACSGKAWCKIKLTQNSQPIQTCAFILVVDRAGVEADTIINAPGFQEQINQGVAEYFDNDPPFFELPENGQSGQALLSDGADGAYWGEAGIPEAVKAALLDCFENVAWINDQGQTYYDALYAALYQEAPPAPSTWDFDWNYTMGDPTFLGFSYELNAGGTANYTSGVGVVLTSTGVGTAAMIPNNVFAADKGVAELLFSVQSFATAYQGLAIIFANAMRFKVYNGKMVVNYTDQNTQSAAVNVANMSANTDYLLRVEWDRATGANITVNGANALSINVPLTSTGFARSILTQTNQNGISVIKAWRMKVVS